MKGDARRSAAAHVLVPDLDGLDLTPEVAHHLGRVLRLRPGEPVTATDGAGRWRSGRWTGDGLEPKGDIVVEAPPVPALTVGFVVPKGDRPERIVRALTELGIDRLVPLTSAHGVVDWSGERGRRHLDRLQRVVDEAVGQCRSVWRPTLDPVTPVGAIEGAGVALADPGGDLDPEGYTTVLVGPEGGWRADERAGRALVRLPGSVLRAETAAVAAGVLLARARESGRVGRR